MNYCSECGAKVEWSIPPNDNRTRGIEQRPLGIPQWLSGKRRDFATGRRTGILEETRIKRSAAEMSPMSLVLR